MRISSEEQVRGESPEVHLSRTRDYCELNGWPVTSVYRLDAVSGDERFMDHSETRRMWRDAQNDQFDVLVFYSLARIGRDLLSLLMIEKHLREHGKLMASTRRGIVDTSTPEGREAFVNEGSRAQSERQELSIRVKAGLITRAKMGQITAARVPFGYKKAPMPGNAKFKTLAIDPVEGPIRALMYELYLRHRRLMTVAKELNQRGYRTRKGKLFSHLYIKQLLLDTTAKGVYYANKTYISKDRTTLLKPESEWIKIDCPALISVDDWERCRSTIMSKTRPRRQLVYPYSGLFSCACGKKMYVRANYNHRQQTERWPPRYECRGCGNKITINHLDSSIGSVFRGFLLDGLPDDAQSEISQADRQLNGLKIERKKVKKSIQRWAQAYEAGALDLKSFKAYRVPLVEKLGLVEAEIKRLKSERRTAKHQLEIQNQTAEILSRVEWSDLLSDEKQAILAEFVESITLSQESIQIKMLYTPPVLQLSDPEHARLHTITIPRPDLEREPEGKMAWGYWLRRVRKERGDSATSLARRFRVGVSQLTNWEMQNYPPGPAQIPKIIRYIGFVPWSRTPGAQKTQGEALRAAREIRGLNQKQLAQKAGVSQPMISGVERNQNGMSKKYFDKIEKTLKIQIQRMFQALLILLAMSNIQLPMQPSLPRI